MEIGEYENWVNLISLLGFCFNYFWLLFEIIILWIQLDLNVSLSFSCHNWALCAYFTRFLFHKGHYMNSRLITWLNLLLNLTFLTNINRLKVRNEDECSRLKAEYFLCRIFSPLLTSQGYIYVKWVSWGILLYILFFKIGLTPLLPLQLDLGFALGILVYFIYKLNCECQCRILLPCGLSCLFILAAWFVKFFFNLFI